MSVCSRRRVFVFTVLIFYLFVNRILLETCALSLSSQAPLRWCCATAAALTILYKCKMKSHYKTWATTHLSPSETAQRPRAIYNMSMYMFVCIANGLLHFELLLPEYISVIYRIYSYHVHITSYKNGTVDQKRALHSHAKYKTMSQKKKKIKETKNLFLHVSIYIYMYARYV